MRHFFVKSIRLTFAISLHPALALGMFGVELSSSQLRGVFVFVKSSRLTFATWLHPPLALGMFGVELRISHL